jgi:hypothetical protein
MWKTAGHNYEMNQMGTECTRFSNLESPGLLGFRVGKQESKYVPPYQSTC